TWKELNQALQYTNTPFELEIFDPISGKKIQNTVACGFMYFMKLNHIAQDKISYRGIGPYSAKTSQPLGGKSRKGGQRLGEMEIWAVIAHGAEKNLNEFISVKSDSIKLRNKYISEMMCNSDLLLDSDDDEVPQSLRLLQTNLKSIGLDYELYDNDAKFTEPVIDELETETEKEIQHLKKMLNSEGPKVESIEELTLTDSKGTTIQLGPLFNDAKRVVFDENLLSDEADTPTIIEENDNDEDN
ncbi:MAG: hypothetical protein WCK90_06565, partial [archaeon]